MFYFHENNTFGINNILVNINVRYLTREKKGFK